MTAVSACCAYGLLPFVCEFLRSNSQFLIVMFHNFCSAFTQLGGFPFLQKSPFLSVCLQPGPVLGSAFNANEGHSHSTPLLQEELCKGFGDMAALHFQLRSHTAQNHIIEWLNDHLIPTFCHGHGCHPLHQALYPFRGSSLSCHSLSDGQENQKRIESYSLCVGQYWSLFIEHSTLPFDLDSARFTRSEHKHSYLPQ